MGVSPLRPCVLCLALSLLAAEAFVLHLELDCLFSAEGHFLGANWTLAFNKMALLCYDNDQSQFVPCGLGYFPIWSGVSYQLTSLFDQTFPDWNQSMQDTCRQQTGSLWAATGGRTTCPNARIFPITPENTPAPVMLTCQVWGFYPADVAVTWLQNGAFVKNSSGVPVVSNGDWTYQTQLSLPVHPKSGDTFTCRVDHASLRKPLTTDWEPGLTPQLKVKVGVSSAVLGVGILFLLAGVVCWCKRAPEGYIPIDGENYPPVNS